MMDAEDEVAGGEGVVREAQVEAGVSLKWTWRTADVR